MFAITYTFWQLVCHVGCEIGPATARPNRAYTKTSHSDMHTRQLAMLRSSQRLPSLILRLYKPPRHTRNCNENPTPPTLAPGDQADCNKRELYAEITYVTLAWLASTQTVQAHLRPCNAPRSAC